MEFRIRNNPIIGWALDTYNDFFTSRFIAGIYSSRARLVVPGFNRPP